jgi:hypothetical protein
MYRHHWISCLIVITLLAGITSACETSSIGPMLSTQPINVALPFVETVHLPDQIHTGQPFTIEFKLSCAQNPDALRTPARPFPTVDLLRGSDSYGRYVVIRLFRDLSQASASSPVTDTVPYSISPLEAGDYSLEYYSVPSREQGGMTIRMDKLTGGVMDVDVVNGMLKTQTFTVVQ